MFNKERNTAMQDVTIEDLDREFVVAFRDQVKAKIALDKAKVALADVLHTQEMSEYREYVKADETYQISHLQYDDLRSRIIDNINNGDCK